MSGEKEEDQSNTGTLCVEITDSPLEDARVEGVFVRVASVELDGEPLADFEGKQTIELSSYQNGNNRFLGSGEFETSSYLLIEHNVHSTDSQASVRHA